VNVRGAGHVGFCSFTDPSPSREMSIFDEQTLLGNSCIDRRVSVVLQQLNQASLQRFAFACR
jgi:hypothetical protein